MNRLVINVDWVPNNFGASPADVRLACVATGHTLEVVEANIIEAIKFHLEGMMKDGEIIPEEYLGEWSPEFKLSTRAQLKYLDNYITRRALSKETGIAEQQLDRKSVV